MALQGIPAIDDRIRKNANEVRLILLPAAREHCYAIWRIIAATAGVPSDDLTDCHNSAVSFYFSIHWKDFTRANKHVDRVFDYLKHIGILATGAVVPQQLLWFPPSNESVSTTLYVPFDDAIHQQRDQIMVNAMLGKEQLCHELLVAALGGLNPQQHLERQLEAVQISNRYKELVGLDHAIKSYYSRFKAKLAPPEKDPTLAPYIEELKNIFNDLQKNARVARRVLIGAILARRDDEEFTNIVLRVSEARRLQAIYQRATALDDETCKHLFALLSKLGFSSCLT